MSDVVAHMTPDGKWRGPACDQDGRPPTTRPLRQPPGKTGDTTGQTLCELTKGRSLNLFFFFLLSRYSPPGDKVAEVGKTRARYATEVPFSISQFT